MNTFHLLPNPAPPYVKTGSGCTHGCCCPASTAMTGGRGRLKATLESPDTLLSVAKHLHRSGGQLGGNLICFD